MLLNPSGIKTILGNGLVTFFIDGKPTFINGPRSLTKNPPICIILEISVFDNFIVACKL